MTISHVCAAALLASAAAVSLAEAAPRTVRLAFKNGAAEAMAKGSLKGPAAVDYVFPAKTGETVDIILKSDQPSLGFTLTAPQDHELTFQASEFRGVAPLDGDYRITLRFLHSEAQHSPAGTYTLSVSHATREPPAEEP